MKTVIYIAMNVRTWNTSKTRRMIKVLWRVVDPKPMTVWDLKKILDELIANGMSDEYVYMWTEYGYVRLTKDFIASKDDDNYADGLMFEMEAY